MAELYLGSVQLLGSDQHEDSRSELLKPAMEFPETSPLKNYPVSGLVNSPNKDDPRYIEPVRIGRDFFEWKWWWDF